MQFVSVTFMRSVSFLLGFIHDDTAKANAKFHLTFTFVNTKDPIGIHIIPWDITFSHSLSSSVNEPSCAQTQWNRKRNRYLVGLRGMPLPVVLARRWHGVCSMYRSDGSRLLQSDRKTTHQYLSQFTKYFLKGSVKERWLPQRDSLSSSPTALATVA